MSIMQYEIEGLIELELQKANVKFPPFASNHEGYAVLLEEVEKMKSETTSIDALMDNIWYLIKDKKVDIFSLRNHMGFMLEASKRTIEEAIQVAAMAQKFINMLDEAPHCTFCGSAEDVRGYKGKSICPKCLAEIKS